MSISTSNTNGTAHAPGRICLTDAALSIAAAGQPVFPCGHRKLPCIPKTEGGHGHKDATTDPIEIRHLFSHRGAKLIGVPTGPASGFDVVEIDARNGGDTWEYENLYRLPETRIHRSKSGGRHYLFRHAPGMRNSASKIAPGVDVRGDGGYVCFPPSDGYTVESDVDAAEWPDWLLPLAMPASPTEHVRPPVKPQQRTDRLAKRYQGYINGELDKVRNAPDGQKHEILRNEAILLGGIRVAAGISRADLHAMLINALPDTVEDWDSAARTAAWGLDQGEKKPFDLENRPNQHNGGRHHEHTGPNPADDDQHENADHPDEPDFGETLPFTMFADIQPVLDAADFVEGLLVSASLVVVYGEPGSGKTFWTLDLALHVAAGRQWRDRQVDQGAVVYLALEGGPGIRNRISAARQRLKMPDDTPLILVQSPIDLCTSDADVAKVVATIKMAARRTGMKVRLVVVDTLARAFGGGNENASEDMGALVANSDVIRDRTGACVLFIHHCGKDAARGSRGHSSLKAATDTEIEVTSCEKVSTARVGRQRDLEGGDRFAFQLEQLTLGVNTRGKPVTSCVVVATEAAKETAGSARLPDGEKVALRCLEHAMTAEAVMSPVFDDGIEGLAVPEKTWRSWFYREGKPGEKQDTKRAAFVRARDSLLAKDLIGSRDDFVWPKGRRI